jgi:D-alanyl-D-alanine carboxypeptidase
LGRASIFKIENQKMKKILFLAPVILILFCSCNKYAAEIHTTACENLGKSASYAKGHDLEKVLQQLVDNGVPGVVLAVQTDEGLWESAKGYAKIEDKTPMQLCHLQYLQSISKTYMAVAILKLYEQGKIILDAPIKKYLPQKYYHYLTGADAVTVRMLLNHTSGIPDYNFRPAYVSYFLQHPDHYFVPEDYLKYIQGKKLDFTPGSKHVYSNINYVILSMIADSLSESHAQLMSDAIFKPLGLTHTFYRNDSSYLKYPELVNSYWDRYSNGIVENASQLERMNVSTLVGDDGIVTAPADAIRFLQGLVEGKLLSDSTLQQMKTWVNNAKGEPSYGLGLVHFTKNGYEAFGHSGGGIGAGCELYYFPEKHLYYFIAINLGTVTDSPLHIKLAELRDELHDIILK